jgi:hypothetical protein
MDKYTSKLAKGLDRLGNLLERAAKARRVYRRARSIWTYRSLIRDLWAGFTVVESLDRQLVAQGDSLARVFADFSSELWPESPWALTILPLQDVIAVMGKKQ